MNGTPWYISLDDISVTVAPPSMNSFSPASLCAGGTITISGTNFSGVTGVTVNGTSVSSFNVVNSTTIIFRKHQEPLLSRMPVVVQVLVPLQSTLYLQ